MNGAIVFGGMLLGTSVWVLLPFIPALRELLRPTDASPLQMVGRDSGDITHFARGFRLFLDRQPALRGGAADGGAEDALGRLEDGAPFARVATAAMWERVPRGPQHEITALVVLDSSLALPDGEVFAAEVYARRPMCGGAGTTYRAVLADDDCRLPGNSVVLRWIHANGPLDVGPDSALYNRASSDDRITMSHDVRFDRLGAPVIEVAAYGPRPVAEAAPERTTFVPAATAPSSGAQRAQHPVSMRPGEEYHWIDGDFELPAGTMLRGHVIVRGAATVRRGALLDGSLKTHHSVTIERGATVSGAVVSREDVAVGDEAVVGGPVIAEGDVVLCPWSTVGDVDGPTTVTCRTLTLTAGSRVHGRVATRDGGASRADRDEAPPAPAAG